MSIRIRLNMAIIATVCALAAHVHAAGLQVNPVLQIGSNHAVPHYSWSDGSVKTVFKAVASGGTAPYTYQWDFNGNGTWDTAVLNSSNGDLDASYAYPTFAGNQDFNAVVKVSDSAGATVTANYKVRVYTAANATADVRADKAIDDGLWYLHKNLTRTTSGGQPIAYMNEGDIDYSTAATSIAIQVFQNKGHRITALPPNPYITDVLQMQNYLFSRMQSVNISNQTYGNPDTNGNGTGIAVGSPASGHWAYINGLALTALGTSRAPAQIIPAGLPFAGQTYAYVVQEMVDCIAWGQDESGGRGGWEYTANGNSRYDGSTLHFIATGLQWAESNMGATIPGFVRTELQTAVNAMQNSNGGFGYDTNTNWVNLGKTGGNLNTLALLGKTVNDAQVQKAMKFIGDQWNVSSGTSPNMYQNIGDFYAMFALMKGARSFSPIITTFTDSSGTNSYDWYALYRSYLIGNQSADGHWDGNTSLWPFYAGNPFIKSAMAIEILQFNFLSSPPVAVASAEAQQVPVNGVVHISHAGSYHLDEMRTIVLYEWDFNNDGTYDYSTTNQFEVVNMPVGGAGSSYTPTLRVTDDIGQTATASCNVITVTTTNHAPLARAIPQGASALDADYIFDMSDNYLDLDGSGSYDPDASKNDYIVSYLWDIDGDFTYGGGSDVTGIKPRLSPKAASWQVGGTYVISLKVTDDGKWDGGAGGLYNTGNATVLVVADSTPVAGAQTLTLAEDTKKTITLTGTSLRTLAPAATVTTLPLKGTLYQTPDGVTLGAPMGVNSLVSNPQMQVIYVPAANESGSAYASFRFTVNDGHKTSTPAQVTVNVTAVNDAPAIAALNNGAVNEGTAWTQGGSFTDPDTTDTWNATVNYGDGGGAQALTLTGKTFSLSHAYADNGTYTVTVVVSDNNGGSSSQTCAVTVNNVAPSVTIAGAPVSVAEGTAIALTASVVDPGTADTFTYAWSVTKDGVPYTTGNAGPFNFTPTDNGTYAVSLTVNDDDGAVGVAPVKSITVTNAIPVASINGSVATSNEGTPLTLAAGVADAGSADTFTYQWTVRKNGNVFATGTNASFTYTPDDDGTYVTTLVVTDDDGGISVPTTATTTVSNVAPAAILTGVPGTCVEGTALSLGVAVVDAGSADTFTYSWKVTRGGVALAAGTQSTLAFTPNDNSTYIVTCDVTDDNGGTVQASQTFSATNAAPVAKIVGAPSTMPEGSTIALTSNVTDAGSADTFTYAWSVTKNGSPYGAGTNAAFSFVPDDNGFYYVTLTVTDKDSGSSSDNASMYIYNAAPSATITQLAGSTTEGAAIDFTSSVSDAGSADTFSYAWTVTRNGNPYAWSDTNTLSFVPNDNGTYLVSLTVTDDDGMSGTVSKSVSIGNAAPVATIVGSVPFSTEGTTQTLTSTISDAGSADTFTYAWTVRKDTVVYATGTGSSITFTPNDNGTYVTTLVVTDDDGGSGSDSVTMTVNDAAPVVNLSGVPGTCAEGTALKFSTGVTDAGVLDTFTYSWNVSRGGVTVGSGNQSTLAFTPDDNGTYVVTIDVTDSDDVTTTATQTFSTTNVAPTAKIVGAPGTMPEGSLISVTSSVTDPGSADTFTYAWSVTKNGAAYASGSNAAFSFVPDDNGSYAITLVVHDDDGASSTDSASLYVYNAAPSVTITQQPGATTEGSTIDFTSNASDPGSADTFTYAWTVTRNGNPYAWSDTDSLSFVPNDNGTYLVSLTVTDDDGLTALASKVVAISNVAPSCAIVGAPTQVVEGSAVSVTASASDAGAADSLTYAWSVTKNSAPYATGSGAAFTFTPNDNGTYVVSLAVSDDDGASTPAVPKTIDVLNATPTAQILGAPISVPENTPIALHSSVADAGSADTQTLAWLVTKGGNTYASGTGAIFTFTPDDDAAYIVTLTVTDDDGDSGSDSKTINVVNAAPVGSIIGAPASSPEGTRIDLQSALSDPGAEDTFSFTWSVKKDGVPYASGDVAGFSFTPNDNGNYEVSLLVIDNNGGSGTDKKTIIVTNVAPVARILGAPAKQVAGTPINLGASITDAGSADTHTCAWTLTRDGVFVTSGTGTTFSFTPHEDAIYVATLTVTDDDRTHDTATAVITTMAAPVIQSGVSATPNPASVGDAVQFSCPAWDADAMTWNWNFGDGTTSKDAGNASHIFSPAGSYTVTVTVTDANGLGSTASVQLMVNADHSSSAELVDSDGDGFSDMVEAAMGTSPNDASSTPFGNQPVSAPQPLNINKMMVKINYQNKGADSIVLTGTLPLSAAFSPEGQKVLIFVGGVIKTFTLNNRGYARDGDNTLKLIVRKRRGNVVQQTARYMLTLYKGNFAQQLSDEGMGSPAVNVETMQTVQVQLLIDQHLFEVGRVLKWSASPGHLGVGR